MSQDTFVLPSPPRCPACSGARVQPVFDPATGPAWKCEDCKKRFSESPPVRKPA